ncbi:hypothetical protein ANN_09790 [Periplaneta americana]|uniref:DUF659 domain-containing protein n=1 Tax=Periplaneta americana TaxID=6978 RepID=A0ABQ8TPX7_PERAM|nr:hypothetical protein ANN_09790 [Periplaneta americana]
MPILRYEDLPAIVCLFRYDYPDTDFREEPFLALTISLKPTRKRGENAFVRDRAYLLVFRTEPVRGNSFEKYTQHTIPDESTLRKTYAPSIYDETIQKIRDEIKDSSIWVSIDETPDKEGRLVGNVVIGLLSEQYSERILLHCDVLEKCNNKTIVKLFNEAMGILWPKGIMYDNVLFFISDAAPYMVKAGQALSVVYPKLTHFTCVAHAFHRVAEVVRDNFLK